MGFPPSSVFLTVSDAADFTITDLKLRPTLAPARVLEHWAGCAPEEATWEPLATIYDTNVRRHVS